MIKIMMSTVNKGLRILLKFENRLYAGSNLVIGKIIYGSFSLVIGNRQSSNKIENERIT
jgi:hypothetical protein